MKLHAIDLPNLSYSCSTSPKPHLDVITPLDIGSCSGGSRLFLLNQVPLVPRSNRGPDTLCRFRAFGRPNHVNHVFRCGTYVGVGVRERKSVSTWSRSAAVALFFCRQVTKPA